MNENSKRGPVTLAIIGAVMILARLVLPLVPWNGGASLGQAYAVCNSGLGGLASALDHQVQTACSEISVIMLALNMIAFAGAALIIAGGVLLARRSRAA